MEKDGGALLWGGCALLWGRRAGRGSSLVRVNPNKVYIRVNSNP